MTDTTEQLLPCGHCACVAILRETENRWGDACCFVKCSNEEDCGVDAMFFRNKHEAIAAWNRRADTVNDELYVAWKLGFEKGRSIAEKPKWTKEPEEDGHHWAITGESRGLVLVFVHDDYDDGFVVEHEGNPKRLSLDEYIDRFYVSGFCKIDIPALPEKGESDDE